MNLSGKIALITGASRGIGKAVAKELSNQGAKVIGTATNENNADSISKYLGKSGKGMKLRFPYDFGSIEFFLNRIKSEFGDIDILVNNAAITCDKLLIKMKEEEWKSLIDINLTSVFYMSKAVIRSMLKKKYGRIINIGSIVGFMGNIGQTNYAATKSGLIGLSRSLAKEVASRGITINLVSPGFISTDMTENLVEKYREKILSRIPINRFGRPEEIASVVTFLASDYASYITGEIIHVNGGMFEF